MIQGSDVVGGPVFAGYVYSYPHKTAYRRLTRERPLSDVWETEPRGALFLYLHVPFCEFRCGFCNLFTRAVPPAELPGRYLQQLRREAGAVRQALGEARFARLAIGGGTPTFLDVRELAELLEVASSMGVDPRTIPVGVECSPATATDEKLRLLRQFGVDRISIGVQSFDDAESRALGRPQDRRESVEALDRLAAAGFPTRNIDLIYGADGQTPQSFVESVRTALRWAPEELYLYPLYIRPLTGLGARRESTTAGEAGDASWDRQRLACYRAARELLLSEGYEQVSMRMFRSPGAPREAGPPYACQSDGMVGLGCGARSYTRRLHYSTEYAVARAGVHAILDDYLQRPTADFTAARHGFQLDEEEQQRRFLIISLLQAEGLGDDDFAARFGQVPVARFEQLEQLEASGLARHDGGRWQLTESGLERSDAIGPWLFSERVRRQMEEHACR